MTHLVRHSFDQTLTQNTSYHINLDAMCACCILDDDMDPEHEGMTPEQVMAAAKARYTP